MRHVYLSPPPPPSAHTHTHTHTELIGAILAVFLLAILYEGMKTFREYLVFKDWQNWNQHRRRKRAQAEESSEGEDGEDSPTGECTLALTKKRRGERKVIRRKPGLTRCVSV